MERGLTGDYSIGLAIIWGRDVCPVRLGKGTESSKITPFCKNKFLPCILWNRGAFVKILKSLLCLDTPKKLNYTGGMSHIRLRLTLILLLPALILAACAPATPPPTATRAATSTATPTPSPSPTPANTPTPRPTPSPRPVTTPPQPTDTPTPTDITVWADLPPLQLQQLQADVEDFQAAFPEYRVALQTYTGPENFMGALAAGQQSFDVVLASPVLLGSLLAASRAAPMSDFFPPSFLDSFAAVAQAGAAQNGQLWGLPETAGFHLLLFYNRELVDTPPATTDELLKLGQSLTGDSQWGLVVNSFDPLWVIPWLPQTGGLVDDSGAPALNSAEMVAALELFRRWHAKIAPTTTYEEAKKLFLKGDAAMMIDGDWAVGQLASVRDVDWGVALLPDLSGTEGDRPAAPLVLAKYWAVNPDVSGRQAQAVSTFLEFVTTPERQMAWAAKFGQMPTRREALSAPLIVNDAVRRTSAAQMRAGQTLPPGINANALLDAMRDPLQAMLAGDLTPQEAAAQMQANTAP